MDEISKLAGNDDDTDDDINEDRPSMDEEAPQLDAIAEPVEPIIADNVSIIGAMARQNNSVYLAVKAQRIGRGFSNDIDKNFDLKKALSENNVDENDRAFFSDVVNQEQFTSALKYLEEDKADQRLIHDAPFHRKLYLGLVAGLTDPINYLPVAKALKWGGTLTRLALEGAVVGGLNASERGYVNSNMDASEIALETVGSGLANALIGGAIIKGSAITSKKYGEWTGAMKEALRPNVSRWFEMEKGELKQVSTGLFGISKQKAKRWVWEIFNNSPTMQMYNSGDQTLQKLAPLIFRERHTNLNGDEVTKLSVEEVLNLTFHKENRMAERVAASRTKYLEQGGTPEEFDKAVAESIMNTYVDINSGELYFGTLPREPEQLNLFGEIKIENSGFNEQMNLYREELAENMALTNSFDEWGIADNLHIRNAAKEQIEFWRKIIKRAKTMGVLDESFGEGGIKAVRKSLTPELANMDSKEFLDAESTTNVVALGHIIRRYNRYGIYANISNVKATLYREIHLNNKHLTPPEINDIVNDVLPKLVDRDPAVRDRAFENVSSKVNFTKEREISIADSVLSQAGMLEYNTVGSNLGAWRELVADTELNYAAHGIGFKNWKTFKEKLSSGSTRKIGKVISREGEKLENEEITLFSKEEKEKIIDRTIIDRTIIDRTADLRALENQKAQKYNLQLLNDVESLLKGTFGRENFLKNNRILKWIADMKTLQYCNYGGQIALSMITDISSIVFKSGLAKEFRSAFGNSLKKRKDPAFKEALGMLDRMIQKSRFLDLGYTPLENPRLEKASMFMDKWTGQHILTRLFKETTAEYEYSRLIKECLKSDNADRNFLNLRGITKTWRKKIEDAYGKFGYVDDGLYFVDPAKIGDEKLQDTIRGVIQSLADQTIQTAGVGDVPRFTRSAFGQFAFMFKTFPFAIYNNILRPAFSGSLAKASPRVIEGAIAALTLSIMREYAADTLNDRKTDPSGLKFWTNVVDYSGLGGHLFDIASSIQGVATNLNTLPRLSTTMAFINNSTEIIKDVLLPKRKINWRRIRNTTPGLNFWWARPLTNPLLNNRKSHPYY
jgi:hypothetical protein